MDSDGKSYLEKSYSLLQDRFYEFMRDSGYQDLQRGEKGSCEKNLSVVQFKVAQEQQRGVRLSEENEKLEQNLAVLEDNLEKISNKAVKIKTIDEVKAKPSLMGTSMNVEKEGFDQLKTLAQKYILSKNNEKSLKKELKGAKKQIQSNQVQLTEQKKEISQLKSTSTALHLSAEVTKLRSELSQMKQELTVLQRFKTEVGKIFRLHEVKQFFQKIGLLEQIKELEKSPTKGKGQTHDYR
ncbi:MAG: hypothetical protein R3Y07_00355 [Eubacteriales bacterium]